MLKVKLSCAGVACHSGYPHLGKSAVDPLIETLHAIKHKPWPTSEELGATTVNIGLVQGGQAANALAEVHEVPYLLGGGITSGPRISCLIMSSRDTFFPSQVTLSTIAKKIPGV